MRKQLEAFRLLSQQHAPPAPSTSPRPSATLPAMPPTPCAATTHAGRPCRFAARRESGLCVNHDPGFAMIQDAARERGRRSQRVARDATLRDALRTIEVDLGSRDGYARALTTLMRLELADALPVRTRNRLLRIVAAAATRYR